MLEPPFFAALAVLAACGPGDHVAASDLRTSPAYDFPAQSGTGREVAFSPGDSLLATSTAEGTIRLWRVADHALVLTITQPGGASALAFTPDGARLVTGSYDHRLRVWCIAISHDGRWMASSSEEGTVRLWTLAAAGGPG